MQGLGLLVLVEHVSYKPYVTMACNCHKLITPGALPFSLSVYPDSTLDVSAIVFKHLVNGEVLQVQQHVIASSLVIGKIITSE